MKAQDCKDFQDGGKVREGDESEASRKGCGEDGEGPGWHARSWNSIL